MVQDTASALFGVEGLRVIEADAEADGTLTVWVATDHPGAAACPECGTLSGRVHEYVPTRPRDLRRGRDRVAVTWLKRRWKCGDGGCGRQTFTEALPALAARCRLTGWLRELAGAEVAERGCTVAEAARWQQVSWPVAHQAFTARADPVREQPLEQVAHLGIDEHRRGRTRWRVDADTGEYVLLADRWHTCFFDLSGDQPQPRHGRRPGGRPTPLPDRPGEVGLLIATPAQWHHPGRCDAGTMQVVALRRVIYASGRRPGFVSYRIGPARLYLDDIDAIYEALLSSASDRDAEADDGTAATDKRPLVEIAADQAIADLPEDLRETRTRELRRVRLALYQPSVLVELNYPYGARVSALAADADGVALAEGIRDYVRGRSRFLEGFRPVHTGWDALMVAGSLLIAVGFVMASAGGFRNWLAALLGWLPFLVVVSSVNYVLARKVGCVRVIPRRESELKGLTNETRQRWAIALAGAIVGAAVLGIFGFWAGLFAGH